MTALLIPIFIAGHVSANPVTITQEITVTAVVPAHRDIVLDNKGNITAVYSNTLEDVTPTAYRLAIASGNEVPLTPELYAAYRQAVPAGTAKYGVLYQRAVSYAASPKSPVMPGRSVVEAVSRSSDIRVLLKSDDGIARRGPLVLQLSNAAS